MGMTRTNAVTYLSQQFSTLEELTTTTPDDTDSGYKQVITDALLRLPVSYDDAIDPSFVVDSLLVPYRALLRFYAVTKFKQKMAQDESYGVTGEGVNIKRSVAFAQINMLLQDLVAELAALGYVVQVGRDIKGGLRRSSYDTDGYEPGDNRRADRI
jgi:hypothetical protein